MPVASAIPVHASNTSASASTATRLTWKTRSAPTAAPAGTGWQWQACDGRGWDFFPPASVDSAANPVSVRVSTVVVQIRHAKAARGGILQTHCECKQHNEQVPEESSIDIEGDHRHDHRRTDERNLDGSCDDEKPGAMMARARADGTAGECTRQECSDRC